VSALYSFLGFESGLFLYDFIVLVFKVGFLYFVMTGLFQLVFTIFRSPFNK
jgi:hypothetical protein